MNKTAQKQAVCVVATNTAQGGVVEQELVGVQHTREAPQGCDANTKLKPACPHVHHPPCAAACTCSWIQYYLSLDALGPTVGVPVTYAAPSSAFDAPEVQIASAAAAADGKAECPAAAFQTYHRLRQQAVPIGPISALDTACNTLLTYWLGSLASRYTSARLRGHPQLLGIGAQLKKNAAQPEIAGYGYVPTQQPDSTPVLAWQVPAASAAEAGRGVDGMAASPVMVSIQAGYDALEWVKQRNWMFPLLSTSRATHQDSNGGNSRRHEL